MKQVECRYCGIEIDLSHRDLPDGVVRLDDGVAHEACVLAPVPDLAASHTTAMTERHYQQARARGPIGAG